MMKKLLFLILISSVCFAETFQIPVSDKGVKIDGMMNEDIWDEALQVNLKYEIDPGNNLNAQVKTTAYVVDTGNHLVVGFKAQDPEPEKIRAFLRDRDSAFSDDFVGVMLDTYNDERRALEFFVNPYGVQMDLIRDDSNGGNEDDSWNAIWDSAGTINADGFVVEFEIPYNELQMPNIKGQKTWGISFFRSHPRDTRKQIQNTPNDRNNSCYLCQLDKFSGFANAMRGRDLEITPSITMIAEQSREEVNVDYSTPVSNFEPSLDINWGISSNLTLNATFNPDFSQVESDSAQLDVNRTFALFFPERRPFFLENSDYFNTRMRLIHTRNVASPDYGVRLVGKNGTNAYGFFYANDTFTNLLIPGVFGSDLASLEQKSNNIAARYRHDFGNSSTFGGVVTRRSTEDYDNTVVSFDTSYRITEENTFDLQYTHSNTLNSEALITDFDLQKNTSGDAYNIGYRHRDEKWYFQVRHVNYDDGFRADLGFIGRVGYNKSVIGLERTWRTDDRDKWWNRFSIYSDWDITHDQNGRLLEKELQVNLNLNASKQSYVGVNAETRQRLWDDVLFDETRLGFDINFKPKAGVYMGMGFAKGDSIDFANTKIAKRTGAYVDFNVNLTKHFNIDLNHSFRKLNRDGGTVFAANQTDLRFAYQFNIRQRLRLSLINTNVNRDIELYDDEDVDSHSRSFNTQLIYSYKVNPKTLLFLGYSDAGIEDQNTDLTRTNRTLFAKFSYAFKR